jgi:hypothetical protein
LQQLQRLLLPLLLERQALVLDGAFPAVLTGNSALYCMTVHSACWHSSGSSCSSSNAHGRLLLLLLL